MEKDNPSKRYFTLKDIERIFGIDSHTVNKWRANGLVSPERVRNPHGVTMGRPDGHSGRHAEINFDSDQVMKVVLIKALRNEGRTMDEVRDAITSPTWRTDNADLLLKFISDIGSSPENSPQEQGHKVF